MNAIFTLSKTLKVGVIGVGGIAVTHFASWKDWPHAEPVSFSNPFEAVLNEKAAEHGVEKN